LLLAPTLKSFFFPNSLKLSFSKVNWKVAIPVPSIHFVITASAILNGFLKQLEKHDSNFYCPFYICEPLNNSITNRALVLHVGDLYANLIGFFAFLSWISFANKIINL